MFAQSFKLVFGVGAAILVTLTLLAIVIGAGLWIFQAVQNPRDKIEARLAQFQRVCDAASDLNPFDQFDAASASIDYDALAKQFGGTSEPAPPGTLKEEETKRATLALLLKTCLPKKKD